MVTSLFFYSKHISIPYNLFGRLNNKYILTRQETYMSGCDAFVFVLDFPSQKIAVMYALHIVSSASLAVRCILYFMNDEIPANMHISLRLSTCCLCSFWKKKLEFK